MTAVQQHAFRFVGDTVTVYAGTNATIQIQQIRANVYRVEVLGSGPVARPVDDLTASWETAEDAFAHADGLAELYRAELYRAERPATIAEVLPTGTHRQVRPTMAGAQLADVTEPQARILAVAYAMGGTVRRSKDATDPQLRALARKGLVTLNYEAGRGLRKVVESATLTGRGQQMAQVA
jgi:hypothetical protein